MAKLKPVIFICVLLALALLLEKQYEARRQLRSQNESLRSEFKRIEQLEAENVRLSNIVVQANTPLADAELAELQRLREEVESLRHRTNEIASLHAEISRLRAALSQTGKVIASDTLPDVPAQDVFPRESWAFAGYDTPENAIKSLMWAVSQGDQDAYMAGLRSDMQSQMEADFAGDSFAEDGPFEMSNITGYRILDRDAVSENEVIVTLYMDGEGDTMPITLHNTGKGWAIAPTSGKY